MNLILKATSYIFHPIFVPLAGSFLYFLYSPRFFPEPIIKAKLLAIAITTVFIPIVFFYLLKNLGIVTSIFLNTAQERLFPLILFIALIYFLVLQIIFDMVNFQELYYFFVGVLFSALTCLILTFFKFKVSLHMVGITGLTMFILALSLHFRINLLSTIAFLIVANGLVASSRLYTGAHSRIEVIFGVITGFLPQLYMLKYWL